MKNKKSLSSNQKKYKLIENPLCDLSNYLRASLVPQLVKNPPAMLETWVQSLGWEDPLEKGKATHSSILAWRIPWTVQFMGVTKSQTQLSDFHFSNMKQDSWWPECMKHAHILHICSLQWQKSTNLEKDFEPDFSCG